MKRIRLAISGFLTLAFVLNCSSPALVTPQLKREWMLVSFKNYPKENLIRHQAKINIIAPAENSKIRGSAYMGCNQMFFTADFKKDGTAKFSDIGSTKKMACRDPQLENDFSQSIKEVRHYHLEGHFMILDDNHGNSMKFIASDWD